MPKKLKTNEDLVLNLMQFSPRGALCQAFVITAIQKYAQQCVAAGAEKFDSGLMNGQAWIDIAVDVDKRIEAFYAGPV